MPCNLHLILYFYICINCIQFSIFLRKNIKLTDLTVEEAIHILETVHDEETLPIESTSIFIAPPDSGVLTDEDSVDEDEVGLADNLCGRQLAAPAEVRISGHEPVPDEVLESTLDREWIDGGLIYPGTDKFRNLSYNRTKNMSQEEIIMVCGQNLRVRISGLDIIKYDRIDHFIVLNEDKKRRCAAENCNSSIISQCKKCNVGLGMTCFEQFHIL